MPTRTDANTVIGIVIATVLSNFAARQLPNPYWVEWYDKVVSIDFLMLFTIPLIAFRNERNAYLYVSVWAWLLVFFNCCDEMANHATVITKSSVVLGAGITLLLIATLFRKKSTTR